MMVSMLFDSETHSWKESLIHQIFEPESAAAILSLPIPTRPCSDKLIWVPDFRGEFSVKSAYRSSRELENSGIMSDVLWRRLWKIRAPERIKMLLRRIASNALPTRQNISLRTHIPDPSCSLCGHVSESTCHIFFHCPVAKAIWFSSCWGLRTEDHNIQECADLVKLINIPSICSRVLRKALEFANICLNEDSPNPGTSETSWVPPPKDLSKLTSMLQSPPQPVPLQ